MSIQISPPIQNEDENQAIDRMFAFVKHEHMETPKSSIITRHRSVSTPRRPLATSTPIMPTVVKPPSNLPKSFNTSGNSSIIYPRQIGPCGDGGTANSRNTSTTTSSLAHASATASKMDESIARAINQQQAFQSKCRAILSEIAYQQDQIVQANEILLICQKKLLYSGTFQEMNAQRTLLVANERRFALYRQLERLKKIQHNGGMPLLPGADLSSTQLADLSTLSLAEKYDRSVAAPFALNITSIKVLLNRSFYIKTVDKDISFAFVVICKTDDHMFATQLMNVTDMGTLRVSTVQFRESIRFQNLTPDFKIFVEIYALKIVKRSPVSRYACASRIANRAKALVAGGHGKKSSVNAAAPCSLYASSDFRRCGLLHVDAMSKGKQRFLLEEVEYPLEGTVEMRCEYF